MIRMCFLPAVSADGYVKWAKKMHDVLSLCYVPPPKALEGGHISFSVDPGCRRQLDSLYPPYF